MMDPCMNIVVTTDKYSGNSWQTVLLDEGINPDDGSLYEYSGDNWQI